jgi:hypothetical protein
MTKTDKFLLAWRGATNVSDLFDPWNGWNFKCPFFSIAMIKAGTKRTVHTVHGGLSSIEDFHQ